MKIYYNAQGAEYEALAQAISKLLGQPIRYRKIPYHKHCEIGCYKLYKNGILVCLDESAAKSDQLVSRLRTLGFAPASENNPAEDKGKEVTMSNINYNVTGEQRKTLVHAMSEILGEDAAYQGAPSFAYSIDGYTVSRDGLVTCPDTATPEEIDQVVSALRERGFTPEEAENEATPEDGVSENTTPEVSEPEEVSENAVPENAGTTSEDTAPEGPLTMEVTLPRDDFSDEACDRLQKIIAGKAALLKKTLGTESVDIEITPQSVRFPWFTLHDIDGESEAYTSLAEALFKMAKNQKRVTAKECSTENEKFTMRLFLIRLGFIGDEYKTARKILLRNLAGNSSWKSGHRPEPTASDNNNEASAASAAEAEGGAPYEQ